MEFTMRRKVHKTREIFKIKNNIYKVAPYIQEVDVKINKLNNGLYKSQIFVHISNRKNIVSTKVDSDFLYSLEKAQKAIVKQIKKTIKLKYMRQTIRKLEVMDAA
jgi:ribosome-associated translation inhibitor RaiA